MCLVVTCWERADLLALICGVCEFVTFTLVSWVRGGTWLYRFVFFAHLLTLMTKLDFLRHEWTSLWDFSTKSHSFKMATLQKTTNWFLDLLSFNAGQKYCRMLQGEHSAILSTFIKLPFVISLLCLFLSGHFTQILLFCYLVGLEV